MHEENLAGLQTNAGSCNYSQNIPSLDFKLFSLVEVQTLDNSIVPTKPKRFFFWATKFFCEARRRNACLHVIILKNTLAVFSFFSVFQMSAPIGYDPEVDP